MSINLVMVTGNLTRDPELRQTQGGTPILSFGVAVNDKRKNQQGEWVDYPNYVDCVVFGLRAEKLATFMTKGMKVAIEGKLHYQSWEKDGQKRSKLEVVVDNIDFMSKSSQQQHPYNVPQQQVPQAPQQAQPQQQVAYSVPPAADVYDEDIPF
ncbi:MAG: single-stranded DNA-binding protein [Atopobiaceae bacterium]|nr:single-stranded DNA-binding protein [Atopobiaceae bacterium]